MKWAILCGLFLTIRFLSPDDAPLGGGLLIFEFSGKNAERTNSLGFKLVSFEL